MSEPMSALMDEAAIWAAIQEAERRAETEIETWIPEEVGDRVSGVVVDVGSISTIYGVYATTTIEIFDVKGVRQRDKMVRVAWMGAVLQAQYLRTRPTVDDIIAVHYQADIEPKVSKGNPYKLLNAVVLDGRTGKAKVPINLNVSVPDAMELQEAMANASGEIPAAPTMPTPGINPATEPLRPGETAL